METEAQQDIAVRIANESRSREELQIQANVPKLREAAEAITIWDEDSAAQGADIAKLISEAIKVAEDERKKIVKPFNDGVKAINARFKRITEPLDAALASVKGKLLVFRREQEEIRRKQAEAALKATQAGAAPVEVTSVNVVNKGSFGTASTLKRWTYEVTDLTKVRLDLLMIDHSKVMELIKQGVREENGLRIYQEETVTIR